MAALERAKAALQVQVADLQAEAVGAGQAALAAELHERLLVCLQMLVAV